MLIRRVLIKIGNIMISKIRTIISHTTGFIAIYSFNSIIIFIMSTLDEKIRKMNTV